MTCIGQSLTYKIDDQINLSILSISMLFSTMCVCAYFFDHTQTKLVFFSITTWTHRLSKIASPRTA